MVENQKVADMPGVREYAEGFPVELWRHKVTGRLVICAENQGGHDGTFVDAEDAFAWLQANLSKHRNDQSAKEAT